MSSTLAVSLQDHDPNRRDNSTASQPDGRRSVSPHALHHFETPGASSSALSCYSDYEDPDPFFGVPSFVDDEQATWPVPVLHKPQHTNGVDPTRHAVDSAYPLTPEPTASVHTASPRSELRAAVTRPHSGQLPASISPQELQRPFMSNPVVTHAAQLTPSQSSSARTSEDGLAPAPFNMQAQSPRVTVSVWDQDEKAPLHTIERSFEDMAPAISGGYQAAGDLISSSGDQHPTSAPRDADGRWQRDPATGQAGLGPSSRPSDEVTSINDLDSQRQTDERNEEVGKWLDGNLDELSAPGEAPEATLRTLEKTRTDSDDNIPLGDATQNRWVAGQTYFDPNGGQMTEEDREIIASNRNWADPPMLYGIQSGVSGRHQPQTAQEAIARFERMCRDNDSILSRQATWGTRRRSIHSTADIDAEGILNGNILKKLSISKHTEKGTRAGNFLSDLRGLVQRRPSISSLRKRRNSNVASDDGQQEEGLPLQKQDSAPTPHLAPPDRTSSWGKKQKPSVNTTLGSNGVGTASNSGTNHVRKRSVGAMSISSPRSFMQSLKVENTLQRPRSRSEAPKPTATPDNSDSHPNLIEMLRAAGGPPVAALRRPPVQADLDDDDDDDDDLHDDSEMRADANLIDKITPNFAGFQEHVTMVNPYMDGRHNYLVERIAHQQIVRYKNLLNLRVKHLGLGANCPCGSLCIAMGGDANVLDQKGDAKGLDPLASHFPDDDDDATPIDGAINQDNFPQDIPLPPTQYLPAEFECQLCFGRRKFTKPSDWTKHVHEDVQPFTCTWDRCRDAKSFKRKADWVRHENEGHRHLEWWTCDVEECRHTCYRRDNFLQHLVREHKFKEPKVKTKAAIKKAGGADPTWRKVEECHVSTGTRPQEEPCRFCGKTFPTWKKLTVHLAKHMEQISLPVLRLVAAKAKEIDADTIISPVQDLPPRAPFSLPMDQNQPMPTAFANDQQPILNGMPFQDTTYGAMYPVMPSNDQPFGQHSYYPHQYDNMGHTLQQDPMGVQPIGQGFSQPQMQDMSLSTAPYGTTPYGHDTSQYMGIPNDSADGGLEPFPQLPEGLGLQNAAAGPMGYNSMIDTAASASPFSGQGSASPYMHSPHQQANGADPTWDNRQMPNFQ